jgi:hypothetical protein
MDAARPVVYSVTPEQQVRLIRMPLGPGGGSRVNQDQDLSQIPFAAPAGSMLAVTRWDRPLGNLGCRPARPLRLRGNDHGGPDHPGLR